MKCLALWLLVCMAALALPVNAQTTAPEPYADNACVQCHRDLPGRSSEIVDREWKQSVHYRANVGCDGCHGGNPSLKRVQFASDEDFKRASHIERNPEFLLMSQNQEFVSAVRGRNISYFCGKCHAKIKAEHLGSPHGEFGDPTCLYCHGRGSHNIQHPSPNIIDVRSRSEGGRCSPCHRAGTMEAVSRIRTLLLDTEEQIKVSETLYKQLEDWGYRNLELEKLNHHAKETQSELRQVLHSFNMRDINNFTAEIQGSVDRTKATYELVERLRLTQRQQTVVGSLAVLVLLSFAGLLVYYKRTFLDHDHH